MSTRRGAGASYEHPKHHYNKEVYHHNKKSVLTTKILQMPNEGLCKKCHEVIEWKKKYRKYKPLTAPRPCSECHERTIVHAYHILCPKCARAKEVCAKCGKKEEIVKELLTEEEKKEEQKYLDDKLKGMSLRQKRSFFRQLDKVEDEELERQEAMLSGCHHCHSDDSECSSDEGEKEEPQTSSSSTVPTSQKPQTQPTITENTTTQANEAQEQQVSNAAPINTQPQPISDTTSVPPS